MNIWIVTIGSSDVQLDSDSKVKQKGKSDKQTSEKVWRDWYRDIEETCYDVPLKPKLLYVDKDETYRIEPRGLGQVYELSSGTVREQIWSYLNFRLLDNFVKVKELKDNPPDLIVTLLSDQSKFFSSESERKMKSPYWQDTCQLEPILKEYFKPKFPTATFNSKLLAPSGNKGLDDWNYVLELVGQRIGEIEWRGQKIKYENVNKVYVSHQAGTPAISSAVQFSTLARFREKVRFLVSNEYNNEGQLLKSSTYFTEMQLQEARVLLEGYDYAGVRSLVGESLEKEAKILLDAAILWNYAEFEKFKNKLDKLSDEPFKDWVAERSQQWWWTAYESAYLAVVRLKQKNTVEAIFHSFRAVEGLLDRWVDEFHKGRKTGKYNDKIQLPHKIPAPWDNKRLIDEVNAYGKGLYYAFKELTNRDLDTDIRIFGESIFNKRNELFHKLQGLEDKKAVLDFWEIKTENEEDWKKRVLGCLNSIAEPEPLFSSLDKASLMHEVHQKLKEVLDRTP